ncbi:hypothetical protein FQA47_017642 [Oryzias melastigma]|uniref:Uncharacterized protein n=1 Tax=Oryzias melastigma TaxID=30732 RepID=A0A834FQU0_ORYME|nr:hypothetical protein FQA47_017642 [Oryzias melastigma]
MALQIGADMRRQSEELSILSNSRSQPALQKKLHGADGSAAEASPLDFSCFTHCVLCLPPYSCSLRQESATD